jgi:hypothetical protein
MYVPGEKIRTKVQELKKRGIFILNTGEEGEDVYQAKTSHYMFEISLNPKWIGLEFEVYSQDGKDILTYDIDTDLYDISKPQEQNFSQEIEETIFSFLEAFEKEKILIGKKKNRPAMIIPLLRDNILVTKGSFMTKAEHYASIEDAMSEGVFSSLKVKAAN